MLRRFVQSRRVGGSRSDAAGAAFDAASYWRERLGRHPGLTGTGTSFMPEPWQRWLYRAKERAYQALLARGGVAIAGADVLDFGCGTGYFEEVWARAGARRLAGVDIVPQQIEQLARAHPDRVYVCADVASDPTPLRELGRFDVVTAIDVLYHVVEDAPLEKIVAALLAQVGERGAFVFSDALADASPAPHVRFRPEAWWNAVLERSGFRIAAREPVAIVHNRSHALARLFPDLMGAAQYYVDRLLLPIAPSHSNNWAVLARRHHQS